MLDQLQAAPALIDRVHDQLAAAIASGELAPGQRLTQESVAALLGVSRQPVSHALQILKRRGLLIEHGKRGPSVCERTHVAKLGSEMAHLTVEQRQESDAPDLANG